MKKTMKTMICSVGLACVLTGCGSLDRATVRAGLNFVNDVDAAYMPYVREAAPAEVVSQFEAQIRQTRGLFEESLNVTNQ